MPLCLTKNAVNDFYCIIGGINSSLDKIHKDLLDINSTLKKLVEATSLTDLDKEHIAYKKRFGHDSHA